MADPSTNYLAGPRHAPHPNASFSAPSDPTDVVGTSHIINAAGRQRPVRRGKGYLAGEPSSPVHPLTGLGEATEGIIQASGVNKQGPKHPGLSWDEARELGKEEAERSERTPGEQMSDAQPPRPSTTGNLGDPENDHPLMRRVFSRIPNFFESE